MVSTYGSDGNTLDVDAWLEYKGFNNLTDIDTNIGRLEGILLRLAKKLDKKRNVYIIFDTASLDPDDECLRKAIDAVLSLPQGLGEKHATFKVLANLPDCDENDDIFEEIAYQRLVREDGQENWISLPRPTVSQEAEFIMVPSSTME